MIEVNFATPITFDRALTMEWRNAGQRIQKYAIEIYREGKWIQVFKGKCHRAQANRPLRACDRFILILRDRRFPQTKVVHETDFALLLPNPMAILGLRAPHGERTGRHPEHHEPGGTLEF